MKVLELNGYKYSKEKFNDYKFRSIFKLRVDNDWRNDVNINIYTDNPNRADVLNVVNLKASKKVIEVILEHWTTKEQDELTLQFLEETLKDL